MRNRRVEDRAASAAPAAFRLEKRGPPLDFLRRTEPVYEMTSSCGSTVITLMAFVLASACATSSPPLPSTSTPVAMSALDPSLQAELRQVEADVFQMVNEERTRVGLRRVERASSLDSIARYHSANMARYQFFAHEDHLGETQEERLERLHPAIIGVVSENVAFHSGYPRADWAGQFMRGLMNSKAHRENILLARHIHLGLGVTYDPRRNGVYLTQNFGTLIAEREGGGLLPAPARGDTVTLTFRLIGNYPKDDVTVLLVVPDSATRIPLGDGRFYIGKAPLAPRWIDATRFAVEFETNYGRGTYLLMVGIRNGYPDNGRLRFDVP